MINFIRSLCWIIGLLIAATANSQDSEPQALDNVTLQLRWVPQAQFIGYYVADTLGFYEQEGVSVSIVPGGPGVNPVESLSDGSVDVAVEWLSSALESREFGHRPVNIAQILQRSSLMIICKKERGIRFTEDLINKTISVWSGSSSLGMTRWLTGLERQYGRDVRTIKIKRQEDAMTSWAEQSTDCISATSYNEYWQLLDAGLPFDDISIFRFENFESNLLEDGLYVDQERLKDPKFIDVITRFTRASLSGWEFAVKRPAEAVEILLQRFPHLDRLHQRRMTAEIIQTFLLVYVLRIVSVQMEWTAPKLGARLTAQ